MINLLSAVLAAGILLQATPAPSPKPQEQPDTKAAPLGPGPVPLVLKVRGGILGTAEIQAEQVETKVILERLKADLKIPLVASKIVADHRVDLVMKETTVVALLAALAPVVLADLEVGASPEDVVWKAIHLSGYNEKEPERELKQVGFLLAAGTINKDGSISVADPNAADTLAAKEVEDDPKDSDKAMLAVVVTDGRVSMRSRKQPLVGVLNEVATKAMIPFDVRGDLDLSPVDIVIKDLPLRDLPVALGRPGVRLIIRRDLVSGEDVVQGIVAGIPRPPDPVPAPKK